MKPSQKRGRKHKRQDASLAENAGGEVKDASANESPLPLSQLSLLPFPQDLKIKNKNLLLFQKNCSSLFIPRRRKKKRKFKVWKLKKKEKMFRSSPRRGQRSKGFKVKHCIQLTLLLGVGIWLLYQVKHSHDKKALFETNSKAVVGEKAMMKLGRKDLNPGGVVVVEDDECERRDVESFNERENETRDDVVEKEMKKVQGTMMLQTVNEKSGTEESEIEEKKDNVNREESEESKEKIGAEESEAEEKKDNGGTEENEESNML